MFCDKPHVNLLTALLPQYGIRHIVVCPGSRNAVLIHNFTQHTGLCVHPVTDERSAAFVALGIATAGKGPVAVCVTSGSALLGTLPAVAEAFYRHIPLLVISADRPARWIGQLDGQTLPQVGALQPYCMTHDIPEAEKAGSDGEEMAWWCRRTICEALVMLRRDGGRPVHINISVAEPLFSFTTPHLPDCLPVVYEEAPVVNPLSEDLIKEIAGARLPVLVVGQYETVNDPAISVIERTGSLLVLSELIGNQPHSRRLAIVEKIPQVLEKLHPDVVVHIGGNFVGKQLKRHIRHLKHCRVIRIEPGSAFPDTFCHLSALVHAPTGPALQQLAEYLPANNEVMRAKTVFTELIERECRVSAQKNGQEHQENRDSNLTHATIMQLFAAFTDPKTTSLTALHLANSSTVRIAALCFEGGCFPVFCNRGVNGIEGTLSAAVGHALVTDGINLVFIGDLSFFYDQNALWNTGLPDNLRIVLLNDGGGKIFQNLPGLDASPAVSKYIAASHHTSAQGIAQAYGLHYLSAHSMEEVEENAGRVFASDNKALILEIFINH